MLAHVHIRRQGDEERIQESYNNLIQLSDEELKKNVCITASNPFLACTPRPFFSSLFLEQPKSATWSSR